MPEPAGAAGLAAVPSQPGMFAGRLVAIGLTGGNATSKQVRAWISS